MAMKRTLRYQVPCFNGLSQHSILLGRSKELETQDFLNVQFNPGVLGFVIGHQYDKSFLIDVDFMILEVLGTRSNDPQFVLEAFI